MNRYIVRAETEDRSQKVGDTIAVVDTSVVVTGYNKAYARYAAFDMLIEAGETIVRLGEPEFLEEVH